MLVKKSICNAIKRTKHTTKSTDYIPQTNESNQFHQQARYNWSSQLLAWMGDEIPTPPFEEMSEVRWQLNNDWVNKLTLYEEILTFGPERYLFWDKFHIYQVCGFHKNCNLIFLLNKNGMYNKDGTFAQVQRKVRL